MKKLLDPRSIFIVNIIPVIILFLLGWNQYETIKTSLNEEGISSWTRFALVLFALSFLSAIYAYVKIRRKEKIDIAYCIVSLLLNIVYICAFFAYERTLLPDGGSGWFLSENTELYVGTFLMPTLLHALFSIVVLLTPRASTVTTSATWANLGAAIAIPILFYVFGILLSPLWKNTAIDIPDFIFLILSIISIVLFVFFVIRFIYLLISRSKISSELRLFWEALFSFLPFIGLLLNNEFFSFLFGDFSSPWFYILATLNLILVCLPSLDKSFYRLLLFIGRCAIFVYIFYFFVVFLPFIPLAIPLTLLFGSGVLMLTPFILFLIQINRIVEDFKYLNRIYKKTLLYSIGIAATLLLPIGITLNLVYTRTMVDRTLEYLYSPDYTKEYSIDSKSVLNTFKEFELLGSRRSFSSSNTSTPYLSNYMKWLVLDNMTLSNNKRTMIVNIFADNPNENVRTSRANISNISNDVSKEDIYISNISSNSRYDKEKDVWVSWVDMSITNNNTPLWNAEYKTQIDLPVGCWISDYYLYVNDVKEMGILAEKKAATWIFDQIRNVNRDPGLLRYMTGNKVEFKVFPFQIQEIRHTGIEFVHKEPARIEIDGHWLQLGDTLQQTTISGKSLNNRGIVYVSSAEKKNLKTITREPYYHFVVDVSAQSNKEDQIKKYTQEINDFLSAKMIDAPYAKISYANMYVETKQMNEDWANELMSYDFTGGFFLDRAIKKILFDAYTQPKDRYPIIVVAGNIGDAVVYDNFADLRFMYPEGDSFYHLNNGAIGEHPLFEGSPLVSNKNVYSFPLARVKVWSDDPALYLPNNDEPAIVLNSKSKTIDINIENVDEKSWDTALQMQAQWMLQALYPETSNKEWLMLVNNSFKSRIMTPVTSYIVVENESQRIMLREKQKQALAGNKSLDLNEDTPRMSEPSLFVLLILVSIPLYVRHRRDIKKKRIL